MTRMRYTMPARSQGKLHMQNAMARLAEYAGQTKDERSEK